MTSPHPAGPDDWTRFQRQVRFGVGLAGLFVSTVIITLAALAVLASAPSGWHTTVVASGSMEPALRRGDAVAFSDAELDDVGEGTIVVFDDSGVSIIHRVAKVNEDGTLTTRGDANQSNDSSPVTADELEGAGRMVIPWIGLPRLWWLEGQHGLALGSVVLLLAALRSSKMASDPENDPWADDQALSGGRPIPPLEWIGVPVPQLASVGAS